MEDYKKLSEEFFESLASNGRGYDLPRIKRAFEVAEEAHREQKRSSGEPYVIHPIHVAMILVELGMDTACISAALLHDVVEDTPVTLEEIRQEFGGEIAQLVDGVTKLGAIPLNCTKEQERAENVRKMMMAMNQDIRVIIIKLADRLHNMRTLQFRPEEKQRAKALETMQIYAPIANRLGIMAVKEELEDLSLRYLDPVAYQEIEEVLAVRAPQREKTLSSIIDRIRDRLKNFQMEPYIEGRVKSMYGIYRKVYMAGRTFDEVYDIYAVRIIVNTDIECYNILGIIHDMFTPIPNRFKDYISTPKSNMYQSLHTTVVGKEGIPFEVQIRTWDMHYTAEYGVAAHWKYKEGIQGKDRLEERLAWIRQIIEAQQDSESEDMISNIKTDLTPEEIYAFTPKGDVKCLPAKATVIDFAYAIHSQVGNKMIGAKADGRIVPLDHRIQNGQIIEILTTKSASHGPSKEWLNIAVTSEARSKIRSWFKKERREENVVEGRMEFDRELKKNYIHLDEEGYNNLVSMLCKRYSYEKEDDLFAAIGYGGIILAKIMPGIKEHYAKILKQQQQEEQARQMAADSSLIPTKKTKASGAVVVEGIDNCLVKMSHCCNPLPGDEIIGFITRGHGVSVHKRDCVHVVASMKDPEQKDRWVAVHWNEDEKQEFFCTLDIVAHDRNALFADISLALANMHIPIHEVNARQLKNGNASLVVTISLKGLEHLQSVIQKLRKVPSVISVERSGR